MISVNRIVIFHLRARSRLVMNGFFAVSRSSRGLGHRPFTAATRVRIPYGMPSSRGGIYRGPTKAEHDPAEIRSQAGFCFSRFPCSVVVFGNADGKTADARQWL